MAVTRLDAWLRANAEFERLQATHPMFDAVVEEIDGRRMRVGRKWLIDFASCNYLGFDLDEEIIDGMAPYLRRWGTHPSWARTVASPVLYEQIEERTRSLLGVEAVLALPTLTHIHYSVLPVLASGGALFVDIRGHTTLHEGALVARARGATVRRFRHDDPAHLEKLLAGTNAETRVVCMDGVNSMTGNPPDLSTFVELARTYDALLYVDDAHGFGVIGERGDDDPNPYGRRGNAVVRHFDESYDNIVLTAGFSKAYSSLLAFVACSSETKRLLKVAAPSYAYTGPSPVASLASVLLGLDVNASRGDDLRTQLFRGTQRVLDHVGEMGVATSNISGLPIIELPLADSKDLQSVGRYLFDRGIFVTLVPYPVVPRDEVGFRISMTAANTDEEIDELVQALSDVDGIFGFRHGDVDRVVDLTSGQDAAVTP